MSAINLLQYVQNNGNTPSIQAGNIADRPATPANGSIYIAVDEQNIYRYNQSITIWDLIGTGNTLTGPFVSKWETWENDKFIIHYNDGSNDYNIKIDALNSSISINNTNSGNESLLNNSILLLRENIIGNLFSMLSKDFLNFSNQIYDININCLSGIVDILKKTNPISRSNINHEKLLIFDNPIVSNADKITELNNTTQQLEFKHISNNRYARYTNDFVLISDDTNNPFLGNYTQLEIAGIRFVDLNTGVTSQYYANFAVVPQITVNRVDYNAAATPPVNTVTPAGWIDATVAGNPVKIPYYV